MSLYGANLQVHKVKKVTQAFKALTLPILGLDERESGQRGRERE